MNDPATVIEIYDAVAKYLVSVGYSQKSDLWYAHDAYRMTIQVCYDGDAVYLGLLDEEGRGVRLRQCYRMKDAMRCVEDLHAFNRLYRR